MEPSIRTRIKSFLVNIVGYSSEKCKEMRKVRNKLAHGGFELSSEEINGVYYS